jgi:hypothetical protein
MSEYKRKSRLVFRIEEERTPSSYGGVWETTHIRIQTMDEVKVSERIYWSCKNPGYYGEPEKYQRLAARGEEVFYDIDFNSREVYLSYLHATERSGYCAHKVGEFDRGLPQMAWATKLLTKISREQAKADERYYGPKENYSHLLNDPAAVVETLRAMGAVEVEYTNESAGMSAAVPRFSTPHTFLTEVAA